MARQYCLRSVPNIKETPTACSQTLEAVYYLLKHPEHQLRNLAQASEFEGTDIYTIRENLSNSEIPFKLVQSNYCAGTCCCRCTRSVCPYRCPQDVMFRVYLVCGYLLENPTEENLQNATLSEKGLYKELTSDHPRAMAVYAMLQDLINSRNSRKEGYQPDSLVYSPLCETETVIKSHGSEGDYITRKVVDPKTGYAKFLEWPKSGVCPFCLPSGTIMRNRLGGKGDRRSKNWKEKFYER